MLVDLCLTFVLVQPGTPNPVVTLFVVDTDNATQIAEVFVPESFSSR